MNKKSVIRSAVIFAVVLAVYLVLALMIPFKRVGAYWPAFVFGLIAILLQAYVLWSAFSGKSAKSKFYGFPIARVGVIYLIAQMVASFLFMTLAAVAPGWIAIIVFVLLLAFALLGLVAAESSRDEIERQDGKLKKDVSFMRNIQSKVRTLQAQCNDEEAAAAVRALEESFRFSDPVSTDAVTEADAELAACVDTLQGAVVDADWQAVIILCKKTESALAERNRLCKLYKA